MTIYDSHTSRAHSRVDVSALFCLMLLLAVVATIALDAYALSTLKL